MLTPEECILFYYDNCGLIWQKANAGNLIAKTIIRFVTTMVNEPSAAAIDGLCEAVEEFRAGG